MKEVKIDILNAEKIQRELDGLQQGTIVRKLKYSDIESAAKLAEEMLDNILDKLNRQNITAIVRPKNVAYKIYYRGIPEETKCIIKRKKDGWYFHKIERVKANRKGSFTVEIDSESIVAKTDKIIKYLSKNLKY